MKRKIVDLQTKNGQIPDFALVVKNNLQPENVKNAAPSAGKYLTFTKGSLSDRFFSNDGIKFNPEEYFLCKNVDNMIEDRILPFQKCVQLLPTQNSNSRSENDEPAAIEYGQSAF